MPSSSTEDQQSTGVKIVLLHFSSGTFGMFQSNIKRTKIAMLFTTLIALRLLCANLAAQTLQKNPWIWSQTPGGQYCLAALSIKNQSNSVKTHCQLTKEYNIPITFASSSVSVLLRKIFFTRRVFPEGRTTPVVGIGGSPSFCCKLSAMTRKTLRPIFILFKSKKRRKRIEKTEDIVTLK